MGTVIRDLLMILDGFLEQMDIDILDDMDEEAPPEQMQRMWMNLILNYLKSDEWTKSSIGMKSGFTTKQSGLYLAKHGQRLLRKLSFGLDLDEDDLTLDLILAYLISGNEDGAINLSENYTRSISDGLAMSDGLETHFTSVQTLTESIGIADTFLQEQRPGGFEEQISITDSVSYQVTMGEVLNSLFKMSDSQQMDLTLVLADILSIADSVKASVGSNTTSQMTMTDTVTTSIS